MIKFKFIPSAYAGVCEVLSKMQVDIIGDENEVQFLDPDGVWTDKVGKRDVPLVCGLWSTSEVEAQDDIQGVPDLPAFLKPLPDDISIIDWWSDGYDESIIKLRMVAEGISEDWADSFVKEIKDAVGKAVKDKKEKGSSKKGRFPYGDVADYLINKFHAKLFEDGLVYIYENGGYVPGEDAVEEEMINAYPNSSSSERAEVFKTLAVKLRSRDRKEHYRADPNLIRFTNGVYNIEKKRLEPFSPELIVTNEIPHAFNQSVKINHTVDKFLDNITCDNGDVKELLLQFVGYTMFSDISAQQAFILTGKGANGKSTFLEMLGAMIGRDNMSTLMLKDFSKNFRLANIVGKLVNIGDDIDDRYIEDISEFKIVSAGGWITVEEKYKKPFDYRSTAKLIFSTNKLPRINDHTDGTKRRLVIVPFLAKFDKNRADYDPFIGRKLAEESAMEYLIVLAIQALHRFLDGGSVFDQPKIVEDAVAQFNQYNNPVEGFLEELPAYLNDLDSIDEQPVRDVYMAYKAYCIEEGIKGVLGKKAFNQMVEDLTGFVKDKVNGQLKWVSAV